MSTLGGRLCSSSGAAATANRRERCRDAPFTREEVSGQRASSVGGDVGVVVEVERARGEGELGLTGAVGVHDEDVVAPDPPAVDYYGKRRAPVSGTVTGERPQKNSGWR